MRIENRKSRIDVEEKLLGLLKAASGYISGETLSRRLGLTRGAVWKHIVKLRQKGFVISGRSRRGYALESAPDRLRPEDIRSGLSTRVIGRTILCRDTVDSTNRLALEAGAGGAEEGLVIFAEEQTHGRGRLGRTWISPRGRGLTFSILLRPRLDLQAAARLTLTAAVSLARTLAAESGRAVRIRWPNDLMMGNRKVAGILTEMSAESDRLRYVVMGVGVNVRGGGLPEGAAALATETSRAWMRADLAAKLLNALEEDYLRLIAGDFASIARAWEELSAVSGRQVTIETLGGRVDGTAAGIDEDGALWIRQSGGLQKRFLSGDIIRIR